MSLKRDPEKKLIGGVCAGLANYFECDPLLVRLAFLLAFALWGVGPIVYLILWLILPKEEK